MPAAARFVRARKARAIRGPTARAAARTSGGWPSSARARRTDLERGVGCGIEPASDRDIERDVAGFHRDVGVAGLAQDALSRAPPMRRRTDRDLRARPAAAAARGGRPPAAAPSSTDFPSARASRRTPRAPVGRNALRRLANDTHGLGKEHHAEARDQRDRKFAARTDRPWHPPARNRAAVPSAQAGAPAPASARRCRRPARSRQARRARPARSRWRRSRSRYRRCDRPPSDAIRSIRSCETGASSTSCEACRSVQRWPFGSVPVGDLVGVACVSRKSVHSAMLARPTTRVNWGARDR